MEASWCHGADLRLPSLATSAYCLCSSSPSHPPKGLGHVKLAGRYSNPTRALSMGQDPPPCTY